MDKKIDRLILMIALSLFLLNPFLYSQSKENGAFEGKIVIENGQPLPGVTVTATNTTGAGAKKVAVTDENGRFRFPALLPGVYDLEAQLEGFQTAKREGIRLTVGTTLTVDFTMNLGKIEEKVTVAGVLPMIDVKDSQTAVASLSNEILQNIPNNQFVANVVNLAPGVSQDSAFGAGDNGVQYQIDGVDVSDPELHTAYVFLDYGTVEEAKVMGIGAPAEYDGFSGVVFNTITKAGGNQFEGMVDSFIQPKSWNGKNSDDPSLSSPKSALKNVHFSLGGPITRDKFWFFAALQYYHSDRTPSGWDQYGGETIAYDQPRSFFKLTWQPNAANSLQGFLEGDLYNGKNRGADRYTPPEATRKQRSPETSFNLNYLHVFSDRTFLETKFGGFLSYYKLIPASGEDISGVTDWGTGMNSVNATWLYYAYRERYGITSALSHHAEKFIVGSHDFKFGIDAELNPCRTVNGATNGIYYVNYDGEPYMAYGYEGYNTSATNMRISGYIQDSWAVTDKLKLNPGIRLNYYRGKIKDMGTVFTPKMAISPRIGVTYDLFDDHSTIIKAHYGRMFENVITSYYNRLAPGSDWIAYYWNSDTQTYEENWRDAWDPEKYSLDPDISMPYVDQFTVGIERELVKDLTVGVTYIYRNFKNAIDRVNLTGKFEKVADSYTDAESGITYNIPYYVQTNPGDNHYVITNPKKDQYPIVPFNPFRKYSGIAIQLNKRFSNGWQLLASYVYSTTKGTYDNDVWGNYSAGLGASRIFDNPNYQTNLEGKGVYDIPHQVKIQGTVVLPFNINLSAYYSFRSGNTYSDYVRVSLPDPEGGSKNIMNKAMGSNHYPAQHRLDLQLEKIFTIKGKLRLGIMASAFNFFNAATVNWVTNTLNISDPYGTVNGLVDPRVFRTGLRIYF